MVMKVAAMISSRKKSRSVWSGPAGIRPGVTRRSAGGSIRGKSRGFTLLELLLVMAMLVLVMALVAPSLGGFSTGRKTSDLATRFISMATYAHNQAIVEGRTYRLNVDAPNRAIYLTLQDEIGSTFQRVGDSEYGTNVVLPSNVTLWDTVPVQPDGEYIEFHSDGRTSPAPVTVKLTDQVGTAVTMQLPSSTEIFQVTGNAR